VPPAEIVPSAVPYVAPGAKLILVAAGRMGAGAGSEVAVGGIEVGGGEVGGTSVAVGRGVIVAGISDGMACIVSATMRSNSSGEGVSLMPAQAVVNITRVIKVKTNLIFPLANIIFILFSLNVTWQAYYGLVGCANTVCSKIPS